MSYSKYRQSYSVILLGGSVRVNTVAIFSLWLPAGTFVRIFRLYAYMTTTATAATAINLKQDGGSTLASVDTTGSAPAFKESAIATGVPLAITAASGGSYLQLIQATTDVTGVGTLHLDMETPFI